jgi:5'(3')-deoxyribonucleotidase
MKVIGIDLDDVLANFMDRYLDFARVRFGRPELGTAPIDWEWSNVLPSKEEQALVWSDALALPDFWETLDRDPGASFESLQALDKMFTLYFPTARVETKTGMPVRKQSAKWLIEKFGVQYPTVIVAYEKGPMATALKYDYFVDDRPKNCLDIQKALPNCKVFLKSASHNLLYDAVANGLIRVASFDEFAKIVLEE